MTRRRRRGAELEAAILTAAGELMLEHGFAAMTMDAVAARAGTNKNSIYRRWPDAIGLGVAAYARMARSVDPPDTGSLRGDALAYLRRANQHLDSPLGRALLEIAAAAGGLAAVPFPTPDPTTGRDHDTGVWMQMIRRAVDRGEAPAGTRYPRIASVPIAMLRNEFLLRGTTTVPDTTLVEIVDDIFLPLVLGRAHKPTTGPPGRSDK